VYNRDIPAKITILLEHAMQHVYIVTEDMYFLNLRSSNTITDVHTNPDSADQEIHTFMVKNDLIDGYKIRTDEWNGTTHEMVLVKWFGILRRVISVKKMTMHEKKAIVESDTDIDSELTDGSYGNIVH